MSGGSGEGDLHSASGHGETATPSDRDEPESWLRRAAHAPEIETRVALPRPGRVIGGKYRIEEQLGRGGMGAVYRATHMVSSKQVALKWMLRPASDEGAEERFRREAKAAGRIDHPNVVDVYDIGRDGEAGYLVMELLRGEPLRRRFEAGPIDPKEALDLLLPAMRGVAAAHREGVVHRDIKPENIFLCRGPDGTEREAKVLDFGISSITAPDFESKSLTTEGTVLGTPTYMSPEQLRSTKDVDARADVYAFGVILYEALTGFVPYVADSYSALILAIANTKPMPPRALRPEIPAGFEQAVDRAMAKDREKRFQTMTELISALTPFAVVSTAGTDPQLSVDLASSNPSPARALARSGLAFAALASVALVWWLLRAATANPGEPSTARPVTPIEKIAAQKASPEQATATASSTAAPAPAPAPNSGAAGVTHPAHSAQQSVSLTAKAPASPAASSRRVHPLSETASAQPAVPPLRSKARSGTITVDEL